MGPQDRKSPSQDLSRPGDGTPSGLDVTADLKPGSVAGGSSGYTVPIGSRAGASASAVTLPTAGGRRSHTFQPGEVLAGRYRIITRLGKGGMGEVYRADDLTLDAQVALKFLPPGTDDSSSLLERFNAEVRLARTVGHPNVCRVYDIARVTGTDGQTHLCLSMEYIDGEDLASLLRRIGRPSADKGADLARQICAGLAAAHAKGLIHRDLKPANIMIDGGGNARLTDFGVAGVPEELAAKGDIAAGTPAYMAPEQLAGREVTRRSDIYSLGLVLYELFTGRPAHSATSLDELKARHEAGTRPAGLSTIVHDIDDGVERIVMRCLDPDPALRPASAAAVAGGLPGGDALAATLAAGETPSPELIASSGRSGALRPAVAAAMFGGFLVGLLALFALQARLSLPAHVRLDLPPDVLSLKAREALATFGWNAPASDLARGFFADRRVLDHVAADPSPARWNALRDHSGAPLVYWHRQSPDQLLPATWYQRFPDFNTPSAHERGHTRLLLDTRGNLTLFEAVAPITPAEPPAAPFDWSVAFAAAGLNQSAFTSALPSWTPAVPADERLAWESSAGGDPLRVEAALERGRPVWFRVFGPWNTPTPPAAAPADAIDLAGVASMVTQFCIYVFGGFLAWKHTRQGRGDKRGAARVGLFALAVYWAAAILAQGSLGAMISREPFGHPLVRAVFFAMIWWLIYTALEPFIRKVWPKALIAWSRLLEGRLTDPLVGRDLLIGCLAGLGSLAAGGVFPIIALLGGKPLPTPITAGTDALIGMGHALANIANAAAEALATALLFTFLLVGLRALSRNTLAATAMLVIALIAIYADLSAGYVGLAVAVVPAVLSALILTRVGVLAFAAQLFVANALRAVPATLDLSAWYGLPALIALAVIIALAAYAVRIAAFGRRVSLH